MGLKKRFGFFFGKKAAEDNDDALNEENSINEETNEFKREDQNDDSLNYDEQKQKTDYSETENEADNLKLQEDNADASNKPTENISEVPQNANVAADENSDYEENKYEYSSNESDAVPDFENSKDIEDDKANKEDRADKEDEQFTDSELPKEKKSFFARLKSGLEKTRNSINDKIDGVLKAFKHVDEELFEELEEALIMADVGVDTSLYIISELRKRVKEKKITESEFVKDEIGDIVSEMLSKNDNSLNTDNLPAVIMVIGVNGVGKTTSIGKMAARFKAEGKKVILGAADTFRAAAIDQLQIWADRSKIDLIKHEEGSDPASVVFDTIAAAKARGSEIIILDTAGRLHNKKNLMDELAKISRVIDRELPQCSRETLLVLDATTGQNAVNQAKLFSETADITGIILTKLDGSAKGGIVLAVSHEQNIPVKLVGVGEGIDDLQDFSSENFSKALFS